MHDWIQTKYWHHCRFINFIHPVPSCCSCCTPHCEMYGSTSNLLKVGVKTHPSLFSPIFLVRKPRNIGLFHLKVTLNSILCVSNVFVNCIFNTLSFSWAEWFLCQNWAAVDIFGSLVWCWVWCNWPHQAPLFLFGKTLFFNQLLP